MQLRVQTPAVDDRDEIRGAIERRLRLALGRHAVQISQAEVVVAVEPSGHDGPRRRCRVRVHLRDGGVLDTQGFGPEAGAATADGGWRLAHRLDLRRLAHLAGLNDPLRANRSNGR